MEKKLWSSIDIKSRQCKQKYLSSFLSASEITEQCPIWPDPRVVSGVPMSNSFLVELTKTSGTLRSRKRAPSSTWGQGNLSRSLSRTRSVEADVSPNLRNSIASVRELTELSIVRGTPNQVWPSIKKWGSIAIKNTVITRITSCEFSVKGYLVSREYLSQESVNTRVFKNACFKGTWINNFKTVA